MEYYIHHNEEIIIANYRKSMKTKLLMIGSSIFEQWVNINLNINNHIIVNRAVGGTITDYWEQFVLRVLKEEAPSAVMIYCGSNDLNHERSIDEVVKGLTSCFEKIRDFDPGIRIAYFGIIKAPQKCDKFDMIDKINSRAQSELVSQDIFVDPNEVLSADICDISKFYIEDQLHMTNAAYESLNRYVSPIINNWLA